MKGSLVQALSKWFILGVATLLVVCQGCGSSVDLAPCRGTVEYEGAPITTGKLLLTPTQKGPPALAQLQPDGSFEVATVHLGDGIPPGTYRVTVVSDITYKGKAAHVTITSPVNTSITVEAGQENVFQIVVSEEDGWKIMADE
jgi:hypothetical protein